MSKNYKVIATKHFSNIGGVEILDIIHDIDDYVVYRDNFYNLPTRPYKSKIHYTQSGNPYFMRKGRREYLSEYIRVGAF